MKAIMVLLISGFFATTALAQEVDLKASSVGWKAEKKISAGHTGQIGLKSAKAEVKDGKILGGEFVIDMDSIAVDELEGEWKSKFITHIKSDDFFDVKKYPTAKLVIDKQSGKNEVSGKLTIKEKTHPVKVKFSKDKNTYSGKVVFDRTKYGVIYGSGNFFKELTADKIIKNDVEVDFKIVLK